MSWTHVTGNLTRRNFLWGVTLAPFLARPLRALRLPVKEQTHVTISCAFKEPDTEWTELVTVWGFDANGYGIPLECRENGKRVPFRPVHMSIRPALDKGQLRMLYALPAVNYYGISDLAVWDSKRNDV